MRYSFIIPYVKRAGQFHNTLMSFRHHYSKRKDYEVIVLENSICSKEDHDELMKVIDSFKDINIRYKLSEYSGYTPVTMYNEGVEMAEGNQIAITNPESFHYSDILSGVDNIDPSYYIVCGCISHNTYKMFIEDFSQLGGVNGNWYQHSKYRNRKLPFLAFLSKKNYKKIGGFDEKFKNGCCWADLDFVANVKYEGIPMKLMDDLLVYHLDHDSSFSGRRHRYERSHVYNQSVYLSNMERRLNYITEDPPPVDSMKVVSDKDMQTLYEGEHRKYTICLAAREIYKNLKDEELKLKLRYICTLAEYITNKVGRYDPIWMRSFYPRRREFKRLMSR